MHTVENSIFGALSTGRLLGYPMMNTKVVIRGGSYSTSRSNSLNIAMASSQAID